MRGREGTKSSAPSTDLLVCFPSRAHLTLMPKPIRSLARLLLPEPNARSRRQPPPAPPQQVRPVSRRQLKKSGTTRRGQASPVLWSKGKQSGSGPVISEPTSPKVTCAGQIKVKPKAGVRNSSRSWQSVMEEIEKIHDDRSKKRPNAVRVDSVGFSKEIMQFLTCLRNVRFNFRCFGSFPEPEITSEDEEDNDGEDEEDDRECNYNESDENSRAIFSKWFMVLQENQKLPTTECKTEACRQENRKPQRSGSWDDGSFSAAVPPPNALLLMRCRSAPAKSWLEETEKDDDEDEDRKEVVSKREEETERELLQDGKKNILKLLIDEEKRKEEEHRKRTQSMFDGYDTDYYKISTDVAKETWVVGGVRDTLLRSRSSKS